MTSALGPPALARRRALRPQARRAQALLPRNIQQRADLQDEAPRLKDRVWSRGAADNPPDRRRTLFEGLAGLTGFKVTGRCVGGHADGQGAEVSDEIVDDVGHCIER